MTGPLLEAWQPTYSAHLLDDGPASGPSSLVATPFSFKPNDPLARPSSPALLASFGPTIGPKEDDPDNNSPIEAQPRIVGL